MMLVALYRPPFLHGQYAGVAGLDVAFTGGAVMASEL